MKTKFTLLLIYVFTSFGYSQNMNGSSVKNLSEANKSILKKLLIEEENRQTKISIYLNINPLKTKEN